jgi:hypothetical protein
MPEQTFGTVHFQEDTWKQLQEYTELCATEVAAMGYVTLDGPVVEVNEVFLVPQVVSGASVEFMETGFPWAVNKALKEGRIDELRFCWHSHVNFPSRFSETDKDMIRKVRDHGPIPWLASVILNKKGETAAQIDYFDLGPGINEFCQHVPLALDVQIGEWRDLSDREEELEEFLTIKKVEPKKVNGVRTSSGKSPATKADEALDEPGKVDKSGEVVGKSGCTGSDWKLHNLAKSKGWASYVDPEHFVHYWDEGDGNKYKGCAPMPKSAEGTWLLDIKPSETLGEDDVDWADMSEDELDRYVDMVMERNQI